MIVGAAKISVEENGNAKIRIPFSVFTSMSKEFNKRIGAKVKQGKLFLLF